MISFKKIKVEAARLICRLAFIALLMPIAAATAQDRQQQLATLFDTLRAREQFNGVVLVAEQGNIVFQKDYGAADLENDRPLTNQSAFELASVSKPFTALAIVQLKERGLLSYDDSLRKFFPQLPYPGVLIRHLLTHTSGIGDVLNWDEDEFDVSQKQTNANVLALLPRHIPATSFVPGSAHNYSNTNYILLASIVEKVTGVRFDEYLKQKIFLPAGMTGTRLASRDDPALPADRAHDYLWDGSLNRFVRADTLKRYTHYLAGLQGAFGIWSTAEDLYKWNLALTEGKLIGNVAMQEALSTKTFPETSNGAILFPDGIPLPLGWQLIPTGAEVPDMYMAGRYGGYTSLIVRKPVKNQTVIILSNFIEKVSVVELMDHIDRILENGGISFPEKTALQKGIKLSKEELERLSGFYKSTGGPGTELHIRVRNGRVYVRLKGGMELNVFPETKDIFFLPGSPNKVHFKRNGQGNITGLTLLTSGMSNIDLEKQADH